MIEDQGDVANPMVREIFAQTSYLQNLRIVERDHHRRFVSQRLKRIVRLDARIVKLGERNV